MKKNVFVSRSPTTKSLSKKLRNTNQPINYAIFYIDRFRISSGTTDWIRIPDKSKANTIQKEKRTI